jgi:hypothetical protein
MQPRPRPGSNTVLAAGVLAGFLTLAPFACASSGGIDSIDKFAWGNDAGWVNFAPADGAVTVTDSALAGYVWSSNDGWINLSPTDGGVTNDGGTLGGFAWDESRGWVSFSGVTIDAGGVFHGEATGADGYAIAFDCSECDVQTTWRPTVDVAANASSPGAISPLAPQATVALRQPGIPLSIAEPVSASQSKMGGARGVAAAPIQRTASSNPITIVTVPTSAGMIPPGQSRTPPSAVSPPVSTVVTRNFLRTHAAPIAFAGIIAVALLLVWIW